MPSVKSPNLVDAEAKCCLGSLSAKHGLQQRRERNVHATTLRQVMARSRGVSATRDHALRTAAASATGVLQEACWNNRAGTIRRHSSRWPSLDRRAMRLLAVLLGGACVRRH